MLVYLVVCYEIPLLCYSMHQRNNKRYLVEQLRSMILTLVPTGISLVYEGALLIVPYYVEIQLGTTMAEIW